MIVPEKKNIEEILGGARVRYSVPKYQRTYDWGKGELQELMDDLKQLKGSKENNLFLGNLIFDVSDSENYKIVDGQQRLTSISILFIALREQARFLNDPEVASEIQKYISIYSKVRNKNDIKFEVSSNIRDLYEHMTNPNWDGEFPDKLNNKSIKRQVNKIRPIFTFIKDSISGYSIEELNDFINTVWLAYVVVIKVENTQDVFSVFERTNARGLDLNIGDLLKNYILSYQQDSFEDKWSEIVDNANGQLPRMLKYFWVSRKGYIQQSKLYKSLKNYVQELDKSNQDDGIAIFVQDLYKFSRFFKSTTSFSIEKKRDWLEESGFEKLAKNEDYYARIGRNFQALKLFRVSQPIPLIFSIFDLYKNDPNSKPDVLFKALKAIENYHFVNNVISGRVGNEVEKFYAETAAKFYNSSENFASEMKSFVEVLRSKKAMKDEFIANFIDSVSYNSKNYGLINYVFDRINNFGAKGAQYVSIFRPEIDFNKRNYNIEHFYAQSAKKKYSEEEQEYFNQIGNLVVISRHTNSSLGDLEPKAKIEKIESDKKHYGNLRYMDDFIDKYKRLSENWDFDKITARSKDLGLEGYTKIWNF